MSSGDYVLGRIVRGYHSMEPPHTFWFFPLDYHSLMSVTGSVRNDYPLVYSALKIA